MAQRRMFSPQIVDSDAFLDMSSTAQNLYFHLGMRADDDGFVGNPKKILRMVGGNEDDFKILLAKRFILVFESGIIVIKHWRINNLVRKDWYRPSQYVEEKSTLFVKENGSYTQDSQQGLPVNENVTKLAQVRTRRLGKDRLGKDSISEQSSPNENPIVKFEPVDMELSRELLNLIRGTMPTFKEPNMDKWAEHCRLMRERDNRTPEQISFVIKWAQNDNFWAANILSTQKLRTKFDTLVAQIKRTQNSKPKVLFS